MTRWVVMAQPREDWGDPPREVRRYKRRYDAVRLLRRLQEARNTFHEWDPRGAGNVVGGYSLPRYRVREINVDPGPTVARTGGA